MSPDELRNACARILRIEADYVASWTAAKVEERQRRIPESEFAHRLRAIFTDLETFMAPQGKASERDIVSDKHCLEIEIKYFAGEKPQGGIVPMSDWDWLCGRTQREPIRNYNKYWWMILPRAGFKYGSKGPGNAADRVVGEWNFQDCLSFTPTTKQARLPFLPITNMITPKGKKGFLRPVLAFCDQPTAKSVIKEVVAGNTVYIRADLLGDPRKDSVWSMFYQPVDKVTATRLVACGYEWLP